MTSHNLIKLSKWLRDSHSDFCFLCRVACVAQAVSRASTMTGRVSAVWLTPGNIDRRQKTLNRALTSHVFHFLLRSGAKTRTTTYISPAAANSRSSSDSHVKDAKKSVPPSPAPKKKVKCLTIERDLFPCYTPVSVLLFLLQNTFQPRNTQKTCI